LKKASPLLTTLFIAGLTAPLAPARASPESDSARIAGNLHAFSDEDWSKIAGEHASEKYEVNRGDTLWDISARLFGDPKVWPKIWEINNPTILNPHMIEPKMDLVFNSGTGTSLPSLAVGTVTAASVSNAGPSTVKSHYVLSKDDHPGPVWDERTPYPSKEWQKLPRQSWESVSVNLPPNIDKNGFDTRNRIYLRKPATGLELPHFVACAPIKPLGHIDGARSGTAYVYRGSEVTIKVDGGPLTANTIYTALDPNPSKLTVEGREALSYDILGKIKILGVQSGTYVGEVERARETIPRGALLVPEIKRIEKRPPIAGASKVEGTILADRRTGAFMSGQYKWVYIDRGTKDGVEPGMIFRIFQNVDPKTKRSLTPGDVFVSGDAQVLQGCENFSIGVFVWSRGEVPEQYPGVLLTDMTDRKIRFYFNGEAANVPPAAALAPPEGIIDQPAPEPTDAIVGPEPTDGPEETLTPALNEEPKPAEDEDWLDKLDNHQELRSDEENELRELEKFHETQTAKAPAAGEGAELPPPPPADSATAELLPPPADSAPAPLPPAPSDSTLLNPPPIESAQGPKQDALPEDEDSTENLPPL
jgi:hypothetical protein